MTMYVVREHETGKTKRFKWLDDAITATLPKTYRLAMSAIHHAKSDFGNIWQLALFYLIMHYYGYEMQLKHVFWYFVASLCLNLVAHFVLAVKLQREFEADQSDHDA